MVVGMAGKKRAIGKDGKLPWTIKSDMKHFKEITLSGETVPSAKCNAVIMGRKTWESIPEKFRPLPGRVNVVLTSSATFKADNHVGDDVLTASSLERALDVVSNMDTVAKVFVIGGQRLFEEGLESPDCMGISVTAIDNEVSGCDTFFPVIPADKFRMVSRSAVQTEGEFKFRFVEYESIPEQLDNKMEIGGVITSDIWDMNPNQEECQYLRAIDDIIKTGTRRGDRTGVGTISKFGMQMRYSLRNNVLPLLTTKRVFWRGLAEELLWFIQGSTNANELAARDIHIWDGNGSREFLDNLGYTQREVGDLGPVYGFQWRHFGAEYKDMHADYRGQGVDQLADCINKIKNNPTDRRILMSAWNVNDLKLMALPPCHMFCQFYVSNGELSCQMYQRSADMGLGVPFNIASYALLTRLIAQVCGLQAGELVHVLGDAHVYTNHVDALKEQLTRQPTVFPTLTINPDKTDIDSFTFDDFTVSDYKPQKAIKMEMAV